MPPVITISILGAEPFARELVRGGERATDLRPVWPIAAERIRELNRRMFITQGATGASGGWSPLADSTIARKTRQGLKLDPLIASEALYEAATSYRDENQQVVEGHDYMVFRITGDPGQRGQIHQRGAPSVNLPARKIVDWTEDDKQQFVRDIQYYVITGKVDWLR